MMKRFICLAMMTLVTLMAGAQKKGAQMDTLVVATTPQMHCSNCEKKIRENVRFVKGTKKVVPSVLRQEVTIVYDNRRATYDDYVKAFARIGYEVRKK